MRFSVFWRVLMTGVILIGTSFSQAGPFDQLPRSAATERHGVPDPKARQEEMSAKHAELTARLPAAALKSAVQVSLSAEERRSIAEPDPVPSGRLKVGLAKTLAGNLRFGGGQSSAGVVEASGTGGQLWSVVLDSRGAAALRVHFSHVSLPAGSTLYVFNQTGDAYGPYTGAGPNDDGEFWSNTVTGERIIVQLHSTAGTGAEVVIDALGFLGSAYSEEPASNSSQTLAAEYGNAVCVEDASCYTSSEWSPIDNAKAAVARLLFRSGGFFYLCSGGLLADTDLSSTIPYLLTAHHCFSRGKEANSLEATFQFETTSCGDYGHSNAGKTLGSKLLASDRNGDFTLVQLSEPPPAGSAYLGWSAAPLYNDDSAMLYRVSHPGGSPQAFSTHDVDPSAPQCSSWPRGSWIYSRDVIGATEGGSSGSPVLNAAGQVVGQLSGGCGYNVSDSCDAVNNATVDGALASYFNLVASYLDPQPVSTQPEICDNGFDDDGDGFVDCADSDCSNDAYCSGGPQACTLKPLGELCVDASECCSGKCKGKPGYMTCK